MVSSDVVTKQDLFAMAQNAVNEGRPDVAETCLRKARSLAIALNGKVDQAIAALNLARLYRQYAGRDDANTMYDEAFITFAQTLGEAHPITLDVQREYAMLLTIDSMVDRRRIASYN